MNSIIVGFGLVIIGAFLAVLIVGYCFALCWAIEFLRNINK